MFSSNISTIGYGAIKDRNDPKVFNTPNEHKLMMPEGPLLVLA